MRVLPVVRRELTSYFNSPIAYIVVIAFLVFTSVWLFFLNQFFSHNEASLRLYFSIIPTVFIFLVPALTMRSWAEERKSGTLEVLLTLPFREWEVVVGKFLGASFLILVMIVLTIPIPLFVAGLGSLDAGQVFGEYLGVLLVGCSGVAAGLLVSSLSANQVSSYIFCGLVLLAFTLASQVNFVAVLPAWLAATLNWLSFGFHYDSFRKGIIDTRDLGFFILAVVFFLFLNTQVLIRRKSS